LVRDGVTEVELTKAKNKVLSALVIKNELPMGRLVDLGFNWMYLGQYRPVEDDVKAIKAVTPDDVNALIGAMDPLSFTQFTLGPTQKKSG
jgi:predicted Zn-dependent peptidase